MKLSDIIENIILEEVASSGGTAQIRRNELAVKVGCAPSQINYVIQTRFNGQTGYLVESRRGGGGGIIIRKLCRGSHNTLSYLCRHMTPALSKQDVLVLLSQLREEGLLSEREIALIRTATSDELLPDTQPQKNQMRAMLFQKMLAALCINNG